MFRKKIVMSALIFILFGCNEGDVYYESGQFKASNNAGGISYVSGEKSGVTGQDGGYTYESGRSISFFVGGVSIGSTVGKPVITPIDLVIDGSLDSIEVQNVVRFLILLDSDGNPENGTMISSSPLINNSKTWGQVNFGEDDFLSELNSKLPNVNFVGNYPDADVVKAALKETLLCSNSGAYRLTSDNGKQLGVYVSSRDGSVSGFSYINYGGDPDVIEKVDFSSASPISYDQSAEFLMESSDSSLKFKGNLRTVNKMSGYLSEGSETQAYVGRRINLSSKGVVFRFSAIYEGSGFLYSTGKAPLAVRNDGLYSFSIDASNNVTGFSYSLTSGEWLTLTGNVRDRVLFATVSDGSVISGTLDTVTGNLSGSWSQAEGNFSGSFFGDGCHLNKS